MVLNKVEYVYMVSVQGLGISFTCSRNSVVGWIDYILEKGGVPVIRSLEHVD
jgi:ribosomal protein L7Ae-like RNA K-turn-binding protein